MNSSKSTYKTIIGLLVTVSFACLSCNKDKTFTYESFNSPESGLVVCQQFFEYTKNFSSENSLQELNSPVNTWIDLKHEMYSSFSKDSINKYESPVYNDFCTIADSIRTQLQSSIHTGQRSFAEIIEFNINTTIPHSSQTDFMYWVDFYQKLNHQQLHSKDRAMDNYKQLLKVYSNTCFTEDIILQFITEEDICFRSVMPYFDTLSEEDTNYIIGKTESILAELYKTVNSLPDTLKDKLIMGMTMRFNRRLIENAVQCMMDIQNGRKLNDKQASNYRWSLLQPFIELEDVAIALLTPQQKLQMVQLAKELVQTISCTYSEPKSNDATKTVNAIGEYILLIHLNHIL